MNLTLDNEYFLNKNIALTVMAVLALFFVITVVDTGLDWMSSDNVAPVSYPNIVIPKKNFKLSDIANWHLMGFNPRAGDLPETNLQLTLSGVLTMPDQKRATAIIASPGKPGKVYKPGELLPGGAILYRVLPDKVIIRNRGKLEELPLVRPKLQFAPVPPSLWG